MSTLAPFGFQAGQSRRSVNEYYVPASDTSAYAVGDPVKTDGNVFVGRLPDSRQSNGMLHVGKAAPGNAVRGVVVGVVAGPGDNSAQSVPAVKQRAYTLLINDNPQALWDVQANNTATLSAMGGMYASYTVGGPLGSVSSTVVDASSIGTTVNDLLIAEVLTNTGANSLLRVAFVQHEMAAAGGSPQIGAQIQSLVSGAGKSAAQCIRTGQSAVGWALTNNSSATGSMALTATGSPFGYPALKITIPNDTGSVDIIASGLGLSNFTAGRGKLVIHVYVEDELGIKQIRPYIGPTGLGRSIDRTYNLSNNNRFRANGHHVVDVHPDNATANTLLTTDAVDDCRLRINAQAAGGVIWIGGVYVPDPPTENWMVVTFDDADISMYSRAYAELSRRGLLGTFNVNWDDVGLNASMLTAANLDEMYAAGHDITSHNRTNTAYPDENPPTAQPNDAARLTYCTEYRYTRGILRDRGYSRSLGWHVFVQGAHDGALIAAMQAHGMRLARGANNDLNVEPYLLDRQQIVSQRSLGSGSSYATAQGWVTSARARAQDIVLMGHVLADTAANSTTWAQTDFGALLDYALAQGMRVGSVSQWAQSRGVWL